LLSINNHGKRILAFQALALFILSGCSQSPNLPEKIVAGYSIYKKSGFLVYESGRIQDLKLDYSDPTWTENGKTLAGLNGQLRLTFVSYPNGKEQGSLPLQRMARLFAFFPGEKKLVYVSYHQNEQDAQNLYIYDVNTQTESQLTFYDDPKAFIDSIDASQDSRWIIFSEGPFGKLSDVYKLDLETGKTEKLFEGSDVNLSLDGKRLVYNAAGIGNTKFGTGDLVIYDFQTKQFSRLTHSSPQSMILKRSPRFSPDGKWVAYIEELPGPGNRALVAVKADGSGKKITLIKPGYVLQSIDWGP